jgi:hypothetical protein
VNYYKTHKAKKDAAVSLRKSGHSYNKISELTDVSKSTLHYWLADIPYTANAETIERIGKARARSGEIKSQQKREAIKAAQYEGLGDLGKISERDLFILGIGLYIGEGGKTQNVIRVINADPRIIVLAIKWFELLGVTKSHFTLAIHLYPDNNIQTCKAFWSETTSIPLSQFEAVSIDKRTNKTMGKRGKLPYGTAHLNVRARGNSELGAHLSRKIMTYMNSSIEQITKMRE